MKAEKQSRPKRQWAYWYVYYVNCDCVAFTTARRRPAGLTMRCDECHRPLGPMQLQFRGKVRGLSRYQAAGQFVCSSSAGME